MNIEAFLLCDYATEQGGKLNVLGAFDTIFTKDMPCVHPICAIALRVRFSRIEEGTHEARINMIDEDGNRIGPDLQGHMSIKVKQDSDSAVSNSVLYLHGLKFKKSGRYSVDLAIDGQQVSSLPLLVRKMPSPGGQKESELRD